MTMVPGKAAALQIDPDDQTDSAPELGMPLAPVGEAANEALPRHVRIVDSLGAATVLRDAGVNLVIRHRNLPDGLGAFVDGLAPAKLPSDTRTVATSQARAAVAGFIAQLWPEPKGARPAFIARLVRKWRWKSAIAAPALTGFPKVRRIGNCSIPKTMI